ncbi:MAG: preprotein translocase subunit SecG [Alphaproteobacteria bacterium]
METVIITIHLMIVLALIATVLLQRSEGGALGIGGGGGGNFMTGRGAGDILTRTTGILAAGFFATSIGLTLLATQSGGGPGAIFEGLETEQSAPAVPGADGAGDGTEGEGNGVLDMLRQQSTPPAPSGPQVPQSQ